MSEFRHPQIKSTWTRCQKCGDAYFEHDWKYIAKKIVGPYGPDAFRVCTLCFNDRWWET